VQKTQTPNKDVKQVKKDRENQNHDFHRIDKKLKI
jgi:hypothetical protein